MGGGWAHLHGNKHVATAGGRLYKDLGESLRMRQWWINCVECVLPYIWDVFSPLTSDLPLPPS